MLWNKLNNNQKMGVIIGILILLTSNCLGWVSTIFFGFNILPNSNAEFVFDVISIIGTIIGGAIVIFNC